MVYPEAAFLTREKATAKSPRPEGTLIARVSERTVKAKWAELVASCADPECLTKIIPPMSPEYAGLAALYPDAGYITKRYHGMPIRCIRLTPVQVSRYYWVNRGEMPKSVFDAIAGSWSRPLFDKWLQSIRDDAPDQMYDSDIVNIAGLRTGLGKDERGDVDLLDTWMWGSGEKKSLFITRLDGGVDTLVPYEDRLDFEKVKTDGELTDKTIADLRDQELAVAPRRNKQVLSKNVEKVSLTTVERT